MDRQNIKEIVFTQDPKKMNWLRDDYPYAEVRCPEEFSWTVHHEHVKDEFVTTIKIVNNSAHPYFTNLDTLAISFPMEDRYDTSDISLDYRCHTHIFCGEDTSYVMCLRMGGDAPHLGMVLTEGSLSGYSVERDTEKMSNDRGCFWLHPSPREFAPHETMKVSWKIFPHNGKEDFWEKLNNFSSVLKVQADKYILFKGEQSRITIEAPSSDREQKIVVQGQKLTMCENGKYQYNLKGKETGEYDLRIEYGERKTHCRLFIQEPLEKILSRRCCFLVKHQQYHGVIQELVGAYLAYDNEEKHCVYTPENDYNGGRERTGMGVLMARFLQKYGVSGHEEEERSLKEYRAYYLRELVNEESGIVCNNSGYDNSYFRLYNYPWAAVFFTECWKLWRKPRDLKIACKIVYQFYAQGGDHFYPIQLPMEMLYREVKTVGDEEEQKKLKQMFIRHGERLMAIGKHYPASEVNYEQSIVAPAADILLQVYQITGETRYLDGAREQIEILDLFNGIQPDYHLNEVAIRHWDGYWFGKRRLYGDTFPHYWSAETGRVFKRYAEITQNDAWLKKAEKSLRGVLPMFFEDGSASCAYLYPCFINGEKGQFFDPYANDQDWGLCSNMENIKEHDDER